MLTTRKYLRRGIEFNPFQTDSFVYDKRLIMESPAGEETNPIEKFINNFYHKSNDQQKKALNNLLSNILVAEKEGKTLALSRGSGIYSNNSFYGLAYYSYANILGSVKVLEDDGFIEMSKGFYDKRNKKGVLSRVWATNKLLDTMNLYSAVPLEDAEEVEEPCRVHFLYGIKLNRVKYTRFIQLKDENKKLVTYKPDNKTLKMQQELKHYNNLINAHSITIPRTSFQQYTSNSSPILVGLDGKLLTYIELDYNLYRVFNCGKFLFGGRFYGAEYQSFSEVLRAKILIDGVETCEVDYSALHVRMLYHREGIEYKDDPYIVVSPDPVLRLPIKKLFQMLINAKSLGAAVGAYRDYLNKEPLLNEIRAELHSNAWELARQIIDKHKEIQKYFYTGIGRKLQYIDSQIAERILMYFTRKKIVCLCIHDSFIVTKQHRDELIEVMKREYKKKMKFGCELKINK